MESISTVDRRAHILKSLEQVEKVNVSELSRLFGVSEVTIRKDLRYLEKKNILIRSRGGAMKQGLIDYELSVYDRRKENLKLKQVIGKAAAGLIRDGETIILDSGTTVMELVKHLPRQIEITVITYAIDIAFRLAEYPKVRVIMVGGILRRNSLTLIGDPATEGLRNYYCDKFFISADGLDLQLGLLTMNIEEAYLSRISSENSKQVIALIDSSKFQRKGVMTIIPLSKLNTLVTDNGIAGEILSELQESGLHVIVAGG